MAKRFIDTSRHRQAWRKLDPKFRAAFAWLTENSDAAGFWIIDLEHFKFECGYALDIERFIRETSGAVVRHGTDMLKLVDFIEVNYGELKDGYNPHKPALRALTLANSKLEPSLNQASPKLEEEEEGEDEGEDKLALEKERAIEQFEALWILYERHGTKNLARDKWLHLPQADRDAITAAAPSYVKHSFTNGSFPSRKYLEGWITPANRLWERPVISRDQPPTASDLRKRTEGSNDQAITIGRGPAVPSQAKPTTHA